MAKHNEGGNFAWFLAGVTVGAAAAILFAPRSGRETRKSIADVAAKGRDLAEEKGREVVEFGREVYDQGRDMAHDAAEAGKDALDKGKEVLADLTGKAEEGPPVT